VNRIACIGSRETPLPVLSWMEEVGEKLVWTGYTVVSGNAPGADQAWARGGNRADPARVELCLPWEYFNASALNGRNPIRVVRTADVVHAKFYELVRETHPSWGKLSADDLQLHARNAMIVTGADVVLGSVGAHGGGTAAAFRMAQRLRIPTFNVADALTREMIDRRLAAGEHPRGKVYDTGKGKKW
jgi:hypothetical protein